MAQHRLDQHGRPFHRYVALGDSFTEGVGDTDESRPNGVRGWADRVAEVLATRTEDFGYANLAVRGRKLAGVINEQLEPALALRPDLVTVYAGGNDIMRPRVDIDGLITAYDAALGRLVDSGATVVAFTAFDSGGSAVFGTVRARFALYNELLRTVAEERGVTLVDFWRLRDLRDWRFWAPDRLHLGVAGHQRMAIEVLDTLGVPHGLEVPALGDVVPVRRSQQLRGDLDWARRHAAPWVQRRLTGRSSGDSVSARRPSLGRPD